jgi:hypothetical protein
MHIYVHLILSHTSFRLSFLFSSFAYFSLCSSYWVISNVLSVSLYILVMLYWVWCWNYGIFLFTYLLFYSRMSVCFYLFPSLLNFSFCCFLIASNFPSVFFFCSFFKKIIFNKFLLSSSS